MGMTAVRRAFVVVGALIMVMAMAFPASATIEIHRIVYDPSGSDTGANSHLNKEKVVLKNTGAKARKIGGWKIRDRANHRYTIPSGFRLRAGRTVRIHTGSGSDDRNDLYWGNGWYIWNNTGDRATLKNARGVVKDRCRYNGGVTAVNC